MRTHWTILAALAMLAIALGAGATPSTLIWIPSTDIQPANTWHLGVDNYFAPQGAGGTSTPTVDIGPEYGFAGGRAEMGIDYMSGFSDPVFFNAKYLLAPETPDMPALAVGGFGFGTEKDVTNYNMVYLLGSKTFAPVRLTLGYCHGNEDALGRDPDMVMAGIDAYLTADKTWWGAADYQSGGNAFGALSAGVAYAFAPNASLIVGYDWYNDEALKDTTTVQLDANF